MKPKAQFTRQQQLNSKPMRAVEGQWTDTADGGGKLQVAIRQARGGVGKWLGMPSERQKTYEFDALGKFVWQLCDGESSVSQISRKLAKEFKITERESQVATEKFLTTLVGKGLIVAAVPKENA